MADSTVVSQDGKTLEETSTISIPKERLLEESNDIQYQINIMLARKKVVDDKLALFK